MPRRKPQTYKNHKRFQKVDHSLFAGTIARTGIGKQIKAQRGLFTAQAVLKERFGDGADEHAKAKYIKNRVLTITIAHPAVGEQIRQEEEGIIRQINTLMRYDAIVRLQFSLTHNDDTPSE
jgi:hypothetical protein